MLSSAQAALNMRILLVEDETELREALARRLRAQGHAVDEAGDGGTADGLLLVYKYSVIVLDRMLPDGDCLVRLRRWRAQGLSTPTLMLTARDQVVDRVEGLEAGADDYVLKPFAMDELLARVAVLARRDSTPLPSVMHVGDLEIDSARHAVTVAGVGVPLRPKEYALLYLLASKQGRVVSRSQIIDTCWDQAHEPMSNVEEALIASLRRKLGIPGLIKTLRGSGYMLEAPDRA